MSRANVERRYPDLAALVNAAIDGKSEMEAGHRSSRRHEGNTWHGGTWDDAQRIARAGDVAGAKRLSPAMLKAANAILKSTPRLDPVFAAEGGRWVDVARYVNGEPECWGDLVENDPTPRQGVAVVINTVAHSGISSESIDRLGVELGGAILGLQAQGYAVSVYVACKNLGHNGRAMIDYAPLNPNGTPLDVSKLSVILRPWFLRRILFSIWECLDSKLRGEFSIGYGYGRPDYLTADECRRISGHPNAISVDVQRMVNNPNSVKERMLQAISATNPQTGGLK